MRSVHALLLGSAMFLGCAHATPVAPSPLSDDDSAKLKAALLGKCEVMQVQSQDGSMTDMGNLYWEFTPNGAADIGLKTVGRTNHFNYRIEGRNVLTDGPTKAIRVDDFSGTTLKWFVYDTSETYFCKKE
ncbi:MAG: hypothetical protein JST54_34570 [Deltaproteobacteria bacterium]|nr:hypothetical protein [Deltaproteobacteria bacterium]